MNIDKMTLSAGISSLQGQHSTEYPTTMAGSALAMIPMLVLYLLFQKQFIEGIALTGTKGLRRAKIAREAFVFRFAGDLLCENGIYTRLCASR